MGHGEREIIVIDEAKCDGCGECVLACAEGAIRIVDGKARLVNDIYCDGLGVCVGECPAGALTIKQKKAAPFDRRAVARHLEEKSRAIHLPGEEGTVGPFFTSCPGSAPRAWNRKETPGPGEAPSQRSELTQWPVQFHLVSPDAPWLAGADLLLVADCVPVALPSFHRDHLRGKRMVIACPKLDTHQERYIEKLAAMIDDAAVKSVTVMIMEVPCCSGLLRIAEMAVEQANRPIGLALEVVDIDGAVTTRREMPSGTPPAGQ